MAHKGVLFLDEMPEFRKETLDMMRQPREDGKVTISRVNATVTYPAEFMMVCAMNPCKCGWYGDPSGRCTCSENAVRSYRSRISGPMLDRIDIVVEVPSQTLYEEIMRSKTELLLTIARTAGVEGSLELEVKVNDQVRAARPIKLEDRIHYMTEKNPMLAELKKVLEMEYE